MPKTNVDLPERLNLRLSPDDKVRFNEAAKRKGLSLSAWIRLTCIESLERTGAPAAAPTKIAKAKAAKGR